MPKLKLKGDLHIELLNLGLRAGDIVTAVADTWSKVGGMHFSVYRQGNEINCSIWPDNYDIVEDNPSDKSGTSVDSIRVSTEKPGIKTGRKPGKLNL